MTVLPTKKHPISEVFEREQRDQAGGGGSGRGKPLARVRNYLKNRYEIFAKAMKPIILNPKQRVMKTEA